MLRGLVITVAGCASRFAESLGHEVLKCVYHEGNRCDTLLWRMLSLGREFDDIVIVGGFRYGELSRYVEGLPETLGGRVSLVKNDCYAEFGSGWSLLLGVKKLAQLRERYDRIVFAEGDLFVDRSGFNAVATSSLDIVTICNDPIRANSSVAFYESLDGHFRYIYDTQHGSLAIPERFISVYNSGQVWGFSDWEKLRKCANALTREEQEGTNLMLMNSYFGETNIEHCGIVRFRQWVNCNTIDDWRRAVALREDEDEYQ